MHGYFWVLFPSLLASAVSTVVFVLLSGAFFETLYQFLVLVQKETAAVVAVAVVVSALLTALIAMWAARRNSHDEIVLRSE